MILYHVSCTEKAWSAQSVVDIIRSTNMEAEIEVEGSSWG
jgi:hypothetical protein